MINSLSKDSHISQYCRFSELTYRSKNSTSIEKRDSGTVNNFSTKTKEPAEISFSGFSNVEKIPKIFTSKRVKKFLELASDNQIIFSAGFALLLTCLLRPASIMALPGKKKNADNKKYAAAQSIASGVIGFAIAFVVSTPISNAITKIMKDPSRYLIKKGNYLIGGKDKIANSFLINIPAIATAVPKAIITIAIIPHVLKYVFGWEKKKPKHKQPIEQNDSTIKIKDTNKQNLIKNIVGGDK